MKDELSYERVEYMREYTFALERTQKVHEQESAKLDAALRQEHHNITQQLRDKFDREIMLAKQCLEEGDLSGYHLHSIEADRSHRELENR